MTIQKTLRRVQYVVNEQGERTAVFLPFEDWETLVAWLNEQSEDEMPEPVQSLDELWGDFWPEDESVDDFIDTVRQWRKDDIALHMLLKMPGLLPAH